MSRLEKQIQTVDGIEALPILLVDFVAVILELLIVAIEFVVLLVEMLVWGLLTLFGKKRERPTLRAAHKKFHRENFAARLIGYGLMAVVVGGFIVHETFFKARLRFLSDSLIPAWSVKYELRSDSGRSKAMVGPENYLTYRWDELVVTDERYEPIQVELTKKDQKIALKSRRLEKMKEELKEKAAQKSSDLFQRLQDKAGSLMGEGEASEAD